MSFAVLFAHHLTVPALSIGFALTLVAALVAAEEREIRRSGGAERAGTPRN